MPVLVIHYRDRDILGGPDAGVAHEKIERAEFVNCCLCKCIGTALCGDVSSDGDRANTG
jgi:hypothetical protein